MHSIAILRIYKNDHISKAGEASHKKNPHNFLFLNVQERQNTD